MPEELRVLLDAGPGRTVNLAYRDLGSSRQLFHRERDILHAASTVKIPVMIEAMRQARSGRFGPDAMLTVRNQFASIVDGSPYALDPASDSDAEPYTWIGRSVSVRELIRHMIVRSSNLATNLLIDELAATKVQETMAALGAIHGLRVLRGVEDSRAFEHGLNNETTALDLLELLTRLARGQAVDRETDTAMIAVLEGQEFRDKIPAGLPPGTRVANKTGNISRISHDAALVFPPRASPYALVVLTAGFDDASEAAARITDVSAAIWAYHHRR